MNLVHVSHTALGPVHTAACRTTQRRPAALCSACFTTRGARTCEVGCAPDVVERSRRSPLEESSVAKLQADGLGDWISQQCAVGLEHAAKLPAIGQTLGRACMIGYWDQRRGHGSLHIVWRSVCEQVSCAAALLSQLTAPLATTGTAPCRGYKARFRLLR